MALIATQSSMTEGACGEPPTSFQSPSQSVLRIDGDLVVCVGDSIIPHEHGGAIASGSSVLFIDGKAAGRIGDPIDCGDKIATGKSVLDID